MVNAILRAGMLVKQASLRIGGNMRLRRGPLSRSIMSVALASLLAGCATMNGFTPPAETQSVINKRRETYYGDGANQTYNAETDAATRKALRNDLVYNKMHVLEDQFQALERALSGTSNAVAVGGDLTALVLNGLAATTGGVATKSALSAASAGVIGAQGAINKDLYYQRTLPALLAQMRANRAEMQARIIKNLESADADYPLSAAENDLEKLAEAGSLPIAVSTISQQAEEQNKAAQDSIDACRTLDASKSATTKRLDAWLYHDNAADTARMATLQAWMKVQPEKRLQDMPVEAFVSGGSAQCDMETLRLRAVSDPKLAIP